MIKIFLTSEPHRLCSWRFTFACFDHTASMDHVCQELLRDMNVTNGGDKSNIQRCFFFLYFLASYMQETPIVDEGNVLIEYVNWTLSAIFIHDAVQRDRRHFCTDFYIMFSQYTERRLLFRRQRSGNIKSHLFYASSIQRCPF